MDLTSYLDLALRTALRVSGRKHSRLARGLVIPELLSVTGSGRGSGAGRDGWHPGVSGEGVADGGEDGNPVLGGGGGELRIAYRSRVVFSERSRPEIFCWVFDGRRSRSAWLEVGGMAVSDRNRSTSASRCLRHSSRSRAGGCLLFAAGTRRTWDSPTAIPWRNSFRYSAVVLAGAARRPCCRARLAWWMRPRRADAIWPGQIASGYPRPASGAARSPRAA